MDVGTLGVIDSLPPSALPRLWHIKRGIDGWSQLDWTLGIQLRMPRKFLMCGHWCLPCNGLQARHLQSWSWSRADWLNCLVVPWVCMLAGAVGMRGACCAPARCSTWRAPCLSTGRRRRRRRTAPLWPQVSVYKLTWFIPEEIIIIVLQICRYL